MECWVHDLMINGRKQIAAVIAVLIVVGITHADMVPPSALDAGHRHVVRDRQKPGLQYSELLGPAYGADVTERDLWSARFLPQATENIVETPQAQNPQILTDGSNSLSLCLCALIGLGLCRSGHWVRKLSLGFVPEWYHSGGPFQIGHSHAVMPNNLSLTPAYCFIQPAFVSESLIPIYRSRTVESLWRKSQFASAVLASRGPPHLS